MKRGLITALVIIISTLVTGGLVYAASTHNVTSTLGGKSGDAFDLDGTMIVDSLKVGAQGVGGVTFFNGTIVNNTTTSGADNPVTFGDNVRIDGRIYRGATAGTSDSLPLLVNDNMEVAGYLKANSLSGTGIVNTDNILDGTIATADLADSSVTTAKIADATIATADVADSAITSSKIASGTVTQTAEDENTTITTIKTGTNYDTAAELTITTGANPVFCVFSGYGSNSVSGEDIRIALIYDGTIQTQTYRSANSLSTFVGSGLVALSTNDITTFTAGSHTIQVGWNTTGGTASLFYNTLDCIELKK